jgi:hypothetical protein
MAKKKEILIVHFRSAMDYPPVYNFSRYLAGQGVAVRLLTGRKKESSSGLEQYGVQVKEIGMDKGSGIGNLIAYGAFYLRAFIELIRTSNVPVIYFESISSPPLFLYFLIFPFSKRTMAIHYHEYFDKEEHQRQSFLERMGRALEPWLFKRARWISHTNKDRLSRFHSEFPAIEKSKLQIMPNYPPESWLHSMPQREKDSNGKVRLVYVGSVSLKVLFLKELVEWLCSQKGAVVCDIYSKNMDEETLRFIDSQPYSVVTFKGSLNYDDLPAMLPGYDVGLILYNGIYSSNFVYNAPNKLFEYLACGLDVWFSSTLISSHEYETTHTYPKVVKVDFSNLAAFDYKKAISKEGLSYKKSTFVMESVYQEFQKAII